MGAADTEPANEPDALLKLQGLRRDFDGRRVVEALDLELCGGERAALHGPNGSGKSTVLRCIAGTVAPGAGEISVGGHAAGSIGARRLTGLSLGQERSFYLRLSGVENLRFYARLRCEEREAIRQVDEVVKELSVAQIAGQSVDKCSSGMLQQLGFARALLGRPRLLLLDEPTRSLDDEALSRFWAALERRPHLAVLLATHRDEDLARCGARVELPS